MLLLIILRDTSKNLRIFIPLRMNWEIVKAVLLDLLPLLQISVGTGRQNRMPLPLKKKSPIWSWAESCFYTRLTLVSTYLNSLNIDYTKRALCYTYYQFCEHKSKGATSLTVISKTLKLHNQIIQMLNNQIYRGIWEDIWEDIFFGSQGLSRQ